MKTRVWLWLFPLLLLLAAGAWHLRQAEPASKPAPREINIRAETVRQSLAEPSIKLVSKLAANRSVAISPEVTGRIATIAVSSGQQVKQGQTLIALDAGKQQAELAEQSASVRDEARKLRDMRKLVARGAVTTSELEGQEATVAQAQARVDAARYELSLRTLAAPSTAPSASSISAKEPWSTAATCSCIWTSWQNCGSIWRCPSATSPCCAPAWR